MHPSTIDLVNNFNETLDFEFEYIPKIHPIHNNDNVSENTSVLQYISHSLPILTNSKHVPLLQSKNITNLLKLPHNPQISSINIMLIVLLIIVNAPIVIYILVKCITKHLEICKKPVPSEVQPQSDNIQKSVNPINNPQSKPKSRHGRTS